MKRFAILATVGLMMVLGSAAAQTRGGRDGARSGGTDRGHPGSLYRGGDRNQWSGHGYSRPYYGWRGGYPSYGWVSPYYGYSRPYYGWRGGYPSYGWVSPYYWSGYPGWVNGGFYAPPLYPYVDNGPFYVEREVEPPQREYREPSYAQARPPVEPPRPAPPAPPPARLERYTLSVTELFDFDKATLKLPQPKLDEIADAMVRNTRIDQVTVTGYTDRIGTDAYNMKLSRQRADAVKAYLVGKGVAPSRLVALGKGKANPVVQCSDKNQAKLIKCLEPNRRVEVEQITVERRITR